MYLTQEISFLIPYAEKLLFYYFHMRNFEKARLVGFSALGFLDYNVMLPGEVLTKLSANCSQVTGN